MAKWSPSPYRRLVATDLFADNLGQDGFIEVRACVTLFASENGGRSGPVRGSYRPNHNFFGPDNREMTIGFIELPPGVELLPGDSIEVPITFWLWPPLAGEIHAGRESTIQEGAKPVGFGKVIEVVGRR